MHFFVNIQWEKHWTSLKESMDNKSLMISQLIDMEWKFGVTASTNSVKKYGNAFLQLKLVYSKGESLETKYLGEFSFFLTF